MYVYTYIQVFYSHFPLLYVCMFNVVRRRWKYRKNANLNEENKFSKRNAEYLSFQKESGGVSLAKSLFALNTYLTACASS